MDALCRADQLCQGHQPAIVGGTFTYTQPPFYNRRWEIDRCRERRKSSEESTIRRCSDKSTKRSDSPKHSMVGLSPTLQTNWRDKPPTHLSEPPSGVSKESSAASTHHC